MRKSQDIEGKLGNLIAFFSLNVPKPNQLISVITGTKIIDAYQQHIVEYCLDALKQRLDDPDPIDAVQPSTSITRDTNQVDFPNADKTEKMTRSMSETANPTRTQGVAVTPSFIRVPWTRMAESERREEPLRKREAPPPYRQSSSITASKSLMRTPMTIMAEWLAKEAAKQEQDVSQMRNPFSKDEDDAPYGSPLNRDLLHLLIHLDEFTILVHEFSSILANISQNQIELIRQIITSKCIEFQGAERIVLSLNVREHRTTFTLHKTIFAGDDLKQSLSRVFTTKTLTVHVIGCRGLKPEVQLSAESMDLPIWMATTEVLSSLDQSALVLRRRR